MQNLSNENENPDWRIADVSKRLSFYQQPFHSAEYGDWVYDFNSNFVFQFESQFDENGSITDRSKKMQKRVLLSLNSGNNNPIAELNLTVHKNDPNWILNDGSLFLIIRGWGNLTGTHNFSSKKASKIQDDFRDWIIHKLSI